MTDAQLLHRFRESRSPQAYQQIVRRHIDLVYSVARRRISDAHLAEDVTQAVFVVLARKAHKLPDEVNLPAWLHKVARCAAADALKMQSRRSRHEQAAAMMRPTTTSPFPDDGQMDDSQWAQVAPLLDDAIDSLGARDRELVIARYLQGRSAADLAVQLGAKEASVRKRLSRAVERLRGYFAGAGFAVSAPALAQTLAERAIVHAPEAVVALAASTLSTAAVGGAAAIAKSVGATMLAAKAKLAAMVTMIALAVGAGAVVTTQMVDSAPAPQAPPPVQTVAATAQRLAGRVLLPDGTPAAGAEVVVAEGRDVIAWPLSNNRPRDNRSYRAGANGSFSIPRPGQQAALAFAHEQGYAEIYLRHEDQPAEGALPAVTLQAWGRIEGVVMLGTEPAAGIEVTTWHHSTNGRAYALWYDRARTDGAGRFVIERAINDIVQVRADLGNGNSHAVWVEAASGQTSTTQIGGTGRAILGQILDPDGVPPPGRTGRTFSSYGLELKQPEPPRLDPYEYKDGIQYRRTPDERWQFQRDWRRTPDGQAYYGQKRSFSFRPDETGMFRIDDVPAGTYVLHGEVSPIREGGTIDGPLMKFEREVVVGEMPGGRSDMPMDLGELQMEAIRGFAQGQVHTPDGRPAAGAIVFLQDESYGPMRIVDGRAEQRLQFTADEQGLFMADYPIKPRQVTGTIIHADGRRESYTQDAPPPVAYVSHDSGYAELTMEELKKARNLKLTPWARVEGVAMIGDQPAAHAAVSAMSSTLLIRGPQESGYDYDCRTTTDGQGRFVLERVPAHKLSLVRTHVRNTSWNTPITLLNVHTIEPEPGQTVQVRFGDAGRALTGRVQVPEGVEATWLAESYLHVRGALPRHERGIVAELMRRRQAVETGEPAAKPTPYTPGRLAYVPIAADGTFRLEDVPAGFYELRVVVHHPRTERESGRVAAEGTMSVTVQDEPDAPTDVGTLVLQRRGAR